LQTRAMLRRIIATTLIVFGALSIAPIGSVQHADAKHVVGCMTQPGCQILVINPHKYKIFACRVKVTNDTRLPIIAVFEPDGFLVFTEYNINQKSAKVTIEVISPTDVLVQVNTDGTFTVINDKKLTVALDGKPHYAILSRLQLSYADASKGKPVTVGEGTFRASAGTKITVAAGGTISFSPIPTKPVKVTPLKGFVLQLRVRGKWITVKSNTIPKGAAARFALGTVLEKKCKSS
jgi:hypothetical protein